MTETGEIIEGYEVGEGHLVTVPEMSLEARITNLEIQMERCTEAVNKFGEMLQYIVNQVSDMGQAIQKGGIGGIMSMMMGKKND